MIANIPNIAGTKRNDNANVMTLNLCSRHTVDHRCFIDAIIVDVIRNVAFTLVGYGNCPFQDGWDHSLE